MFGFFRWYAGLTRWMKYGVALVVLGLSGGASAVGAFWPWGWGAGIVLLLAAMFIEE